MQRAGWTTASAMGMALACRTSPPVEPDVPVPTAVAAPAAEPALEPEDPAEPEPEPEPEPDPPVADASVPDLDDPFARGRSPDSRPRPPTRAEPPPDLERVIVGEGDRPCAAIPFATVVAAVPGRARARMREDGEHDRPATTLGGPLDLCVVHERWGGVESTVVLVDGTGRVRGTKTFTRRVPTVGLVDLFGDDVPEFVVEVVEGTAMSSWPRVWKIFRVTGPGRLVEVITFAKSYDYGARDPEPYFHNTVTMPAKGTLRVETTVFESRGPAPPARAPRAASEAYELHYDARRQRFDRRPG